MITASKTEYFVEDTEGEERGYENSFFFNNFPEANKVGTTKLASDTALALCL